MKLWRSYGFLSMQEGEDIVEALHLALYTSLSCCCWTKLVVNQYINIVEEPQLAIRTCCLDGLDSILLKKVKILLRRFTLLSIPLCHAAVGPNLL